MSNRFRIPFTHTHTLPKLQPKLLPRTGRKRRPISWNKASAPSLTKLFNLFMKSAFCLQKLCSLPLLWSNDIAVKVDRFHKPLICKSSMAIRGLKWQQKLATLAFWQPVLPCQAVIQKHFVQPTIDICYRKKQFLLEIYQNAHRWNSCKITTYLLISANKEELLLNRFHSFSVGTEPGVKHERAKEDLGLLISTTLSSISRSLSPFKSYAMAMLIQFIHHTL